ncbi:enoyl-CoA hydratase [Candidatus Nephthysia bennettiae]
MERAAGSPGPAAGAGDDILVEMEGGIAGIVFNRPATRNAVSAEMCTRLIELCGEFAADRSIRVVVFRGAGGKAFASGADISEVRDLKGEAAVREFLGRWQRLLTAIDEIPIPTIAAIQGACTGGGASIALSCDLRVATPGSRFGFPIARHLGSGLTIENFVRLTSLIGLAKTKEILYTARLVPAAEALALGVYNEVSGDEESLLPRVRELAAEIAANAPLTHRATKQSLLRIRQQMTPPGDNYDLAVQAYLSRDFQEGVGAFLEKRKPRWRGE